MNRSIWRDPYTWGALACLVFLVVVILGWGV